MNGGCYLVGWATLCLVGGWATSWHLGRPFTAVWNVPTARCQTHFGQPLLLEPFGIVYNQAQRFRGQNITIFYKNQFGLYPYLGPRGVLHHGGIPQAVHLHKHLALVTSQISGLMHEGFRGLAVLDWEEWHPLWNRNWGPRWIYRKASWAWAQQQWPDLPPKQQRLEARAAFERAARALMEGTLQLAQVLRPRGLWGFYRFPLCRSPWRGRHNYTGKCQMADKAYNDQLRWLWEASTALFPSIYLPPGLPQVYRKSYARHRLEEAFRVARFGHPRPLPVLAYTRLTHLSSGQFLSQNDLIQTIGVSVALGIEGVVLWGDLSFSSSREQCELLQSYLSDILGPYLSNVTRAAHACSQQLCHGNGRCARREPNNDDIFLHLEPAGALGAPREDPDKWTHFRCLCYPGWAGTTCKVPVPGTE
ncbi:hyaluronidase-3 isoform X1 [Phascolarctos cinereus]|uniref:Hyaluronidase n=1 Tax=Phascolarctos cinereus TaxID=38626 RepID=A0A6P5L9Z1_PHACI|nr:hyaluronidase-3 isoform X1 [Phascolarctos cinereus]XP_020854849.1 hyaluronidase-3 isoform X1 [Phascolarctos cinereus]